MNTATRTLARKLLLKAKELQTTGSLLLCSLQVIAINQDSVNAIDNKTELDGYISHALSKHIIHQLTLKAKSNLTSQNGIKVTEASKDMAFVNDAALDNSPYYKAYKHIIKSIIGDTPLMHLHIKAVEIVAGLTYQFKCQHKKSTITEIVLDKCKEEIIIYSNFILADSLCLNSAQTTNAFAA